MSNIIRLLTDQQLDAIEQASADVRAAAVKLSRFPHSPAPTLERELARATAAYFAVCEAALGRSAAIVDDGKEAAE